MICGGKIVMYRRIQQRHSGQKGVLLPICVICGETPPRGIAGGMVVSGCFLCTRCENEIVRSRVGDSHYSQIKEKLKKIWGYVKP
jgi:hypothetical protein